MQRLAVSPGIQVMSFRQAGGYVRRFSYLSRHTVPEGAIDLATNYPPHDIELIGPSIDLVARKDLHPALSDLLIAAAREVHGGPGIFHDAGQYPAAEASDFPLSADAERYYKSGGHFLYKRLPFWLASLIARVAVVLVPLLVLLRPATRTAARLYRWRVRSRIERSYRALVAIDREVQPDLSPERRAQLARRLDHLRAVVNAMKAPSSFAPHLYRLRDDLGIVTRRLVAAHP
jgi:hypothetical protein